MRRIILSGILALSVLSCSTPGRFIVTGLGYEPTEVRESVIYALPKTIIQVGVEYRRDLFIPGPYADYAQKMLGIEGVKKQRSETFSISAVTLAEQLEPDTEHFYTINILEGSSRMNFLDMAMRNGLIIRGNYLVDANVSVEVPESLPSELVYTDLTMEPNTELKQQTIYKTIITDTSFLDVPVTTQQLERKTLEKKAEEAAKLILEIRSDRYYLAAGIIDPYPVNFDLKTALERLDKLEKDYLSLFVGKSFSENLVRKYLVIPEEGLVNESITLGNFSPEKGLNAADGSILRLDISSAGNSDSFRNLLPQMPEIEAYNRFYYRIPEVCDLKVVHEKKILIEKRLSIYQAGALVSEKIEP